MPTDSGRAAARLAAGALLVLFATASAAQAQSTSTVVISQVYGGGGNNGAPFRNDFIELYNRGTEPVPIDGLVGPVRVRGGRLAGR